MLYGRVEITSYGLLIISKTGERVAFDRDFTMLATSRVINTNLDFLYFFLMGDAERKLVQKWYAEQSAQNQRQERFLAIVGEALENVKYSYRISTLEPIRTINNQIEYSVGCDIYNQAELHDWEEKANNFGGTKYTSGLATLYELFLWYAYRVAMGYWTLENVCSKIRKNTKMKRVGANKLGGFLDGVLNTYKIVKTPDGKGYCVVGREIDEEEDDQSLLFCITNVVECEKEHLPSCYEVGVIALRGENI